MMKICRRRAIFRLNNILDIRETSGAATSIAAPVSGRLHTPDLPRPKARRVTGGYAGAARSLSDPDLVRSRSFRFGTLPSWAGVHPGVRQFAVALLRDLHARHFPIVVAETLRTEASHLELYDLGLTSKPYHHTAHSFGCAVDLAHASRGFDIRPVEWEVIAAAAFEVARRRNFPLVWGGHAHPYDPSHFELAHWAELRADWLFSELDGDFMESVQPDTFFQNLELRRAIRIKEARDASGGTPQGRKPLSRPTCH